MYTPMHVHTYVKSSHINLQQTIVYNLNRVRTVTFSNFVPVFAKAINCTWLLTWFILHKSHVVNFCNRKNPNVRCFATNGEIIESQLKSSFSESSQKYFFSFPVGVTVPLLSQGLTNYRLTNTRNLSCFTR